MEATTQYTAPAARAVPGAPTNVRITGVDIGFGDLVVLLIKITLAYIPVMIILMILFAIAGVIFGGVFAGIMGSLL
jgi:hypothetical protein